MSAGTHLKEHFQDLERQTRAARLGMWLVLVSEILLFSALFTLYASYRIEYGDAFRRAARETALGLGSAMTFVLVTSDLCVALGLQAIRRGARGRCTGWLLTAAGLGALFLFLKGWEYADHLGVGIAPGVYYAYPFLPGGGAKVFFTLYYLMTGLHALHVIVGVGILLALAFLTRARRLGADYHTPMELGGMYWHLVDIIWAFLWPLFYLLR